MLEDSTALFEFVVRDAAWWFRQAVNGVQLGDAGASTGSALNVDVPITPPTEEVTVSCSGLRHARHEQHTIPGHAIAVSPNPVPAGTTSVKVAFDPFESLRAPMNGKLVTWTDRPGESEHYGDVCSTSAATTNDSERWNMTVLAELIDGMLASAAQEAARSDWDAVRTHVDDVLILSARDPEALALAALTERIVPGDSGRRLR